MKRTILVHTAIGGLLSALTLVAHANPTVDAQGRLASKDGKTLYTFTKDSAGKSVCNGACAAAWPPFVVANPALAGGDFSIVTRDDGARQWAFKGQPLYFFAGDAKAGDANGEGQGGVWFTVKSAAATPAKTSQRGGYYDSVSTYDKYAY